MACERAYDHLAAFKETACLHLYNTCQRGRRSRLAEYSLTRSDELIRIYYLVVCYHIYDTAAIVPCLNGAIPTRGLSYAYGRGYSLRVIDHLALNEWCRSCGLKAHHFREGIDKTLFFIFFIALPIGRNITCIAYRQEVHIRGAPELSAYLKGRRLLPFYTKGIKRVDHSYGILICKLSDYIECVIEASVYLKYHCPVHNGLR